MPALPDIDGEVVSVEPGADVAVFTADRSEGLASDLPNLLAGIGILATADGTTVLADVAGESYRITVARA